MQINNELKTIKNLAILVTKEAALPVRIQRKTVHFAGNILKRNSKNSAGMESSSSSLPLDALLAGGCVV
jgi:hypothetical protein